MLGKILSRGFWSWWDHISFSILNSVLAALNPLFLALVASIMWAIGQSAEIFVEYRALFAVIFGASILGMGAFPSTLAALSMERRMTDGETVSYFTEYWGEFRRLFLKGLPVFIIYSLAGGLLGFSLYFYLFVIGGLFPFNLVVTAISLWFAVWILSSQLFTLPLLVTEDFPFHEAVLFGLVTAARQGLRSLLVGAFLTALMLVLFIALVSPYTAILPLVTYFGLSGNISIWAFRYLADDTPPPDAPERSLSELFSPFTNIFSKAQKKDTKKRP